MRKHNGFTLIEVVVSLALLGIVVVSYLTIIGSGYNQLRKTSQVTVDTFEKQKDMESKILEVKNPSTTVPFDKKVELFSGTAYESEVDVTHIHIPIVGQRAYDAFVSHTKTIELPSPKIESFAVGVYQKNTQNLAFPWEDEINSGISELRGNYQISTEPQLYQVNFRWYASKEIPPAKGDKWDISVDGIWNPMFSSGYDILAQWAEEPIYISQKTLTAGAVQAGKFYHFEMMPFTLHGKLAQQINNPRILVQRKSTNDFWNNLIENAYFQKSAIENIGTIVEVTNRADRPTMHIASKDNKNPEGALLDIALSDADYETFNTEFSYQFDKVTLDRLSNTEKLEMGIFLEDKDNLNSGYMIELDAIKKEIKLKNIVNNRYTSLPIQSHAVNLDWKKEQKITLTHNVADNTIVAKISDNTNTETINFSGIKPMKIGNIGLKSYSSLEYISANDINLLGQYYRNYAVHFYDLNYNKLRIPNILENVFVFGSSLSLGGSSNITGSKAIVITDKAEDFSLTGAVNIDADNIWINRPGREVEITGSVNLGATKKVERIQIESNLSISGSGKINSQIFNTIGDVYLTGSGSIETDMAYITGNVSLDGGTLIKAKEVYIDGNLSFPGSGRIEADIVYIKGNVDYMNGGNTENIRAEEVYIAGNLNMDSSGRVVASEKLYIQGDVYLNKADAAVILENDSALANIIEGRLLFGENGGAITKYSGDIATLYIKDDISFFNIGIGYINIDAVYYGGTIRNYYSNQIPYNTRHISWPSISPTPQIPSIKTYTLVDMPTLPKLRSDSWYIERGYTSLSNNIPLYDNAKIIENGDITVIPERNWEGNPKKIVIISKTGDITLNNSGNRWESVEAVLIAPNGKVNLSSYLANFRGIVISKDGFIVENGNVTIKELPISDFFSNSSDYPVMSGE